MATDCPCIEGWANQQVPFHRSLSKELARYSEARAEYVDSDPAAHFFVSCGQNRLPVSTAHGTIQQLFVTAGLKAETGRAGPSPYDFPVDACLFSMRQIDQPNWPGARTDIAHDHRAYRLRRFLVSFSIGRFGLTAEDGTLIHDELIRLNHTSDLPLATPSMTLRSTEPSHQTVAELERR